jgi:NAD(P)-dependent dehydrogenase (short-subunit alcohol dehydrogenase family)
MVKSIWQPASIGQATCRRLAQSGHIAAGIDVGADGADFNLPVRYEDLARNGSHARHVEAPQADPVLFNNAGIYHPVKDWLDAARAVDDTMSVNVRVPHSPRWWRSG